MELVVFVRGGPKLVPSVVTLKAQLVPLPIHASFIVSFILTDRSTVSDLLTWLLFPAVHRPVTEN